MTAIKSHMLGHPRFPTRSLPGPATLTALMKQKRDYSKRMRARRKGVNRSIALMERLFRQFIRQFLQGAQVEFAGAQQRDLLDEMEVLALGGP